MTLVYSEFVRYASGNSSLRFGEVLGPESPEEDSLQTPSELLVEVAELLPTLRQARHLLRRVEAVAENLLRQLSLSLIHI